MLEISHFLVKHLEIKGCPWRESTSKSVAACADMYEHKNRTGLGVHPLLFPRSHLSASTSRGVFPWAQLFTIQPESMAARKPRAMPVPMGQKGWRKSKHIQYPNMVKYANYNKYPRLKRALNQHLNLKNFKTVSWKSLKGTNAFHMLHCWMLIWSVSKVSNNEISTIWVRKTLRFRQYKA